MFPRPSEGRGVGGGAFVSSIFKESRINPHPCDGRGRACAVGGQNRNHATDQVTTKFQNTFGQDANLSERLIHGQWPGCQFWIRKEPAACHCYRQAAPPEHPSDPTSTNTGW